MFEISNLFVVAFVFTLMLCNQMKDLAKGINIMLLPKVQVRALLQIARKTMCLLSILSTDMRTA